MAGGRRTLATAVVPVEATKEFQRRFTALHVDEAVAMSYGQLAAWVVAGRQRRSRVMGLLIAAAAHAHSARLIRGTRTTSRASSSSSTRLRVSPSTGHSAELAAMKRPDPARRRARSSWQCDVRVLSRIGRVAFQQMARPQERTRCRNRACRARGTEGAPRRSSRPNTSPTSRRLARLAAVTAAESQQVTAPTGRALRVLNWRPTCDVSA